MAWSTRQLAELAGTTVKAVRHYHELGLLDEPPRKSNGYKQYGVAELVRLLQIKRLVDLGVPLAQVASVGRADEQPDEALRVIDAELAATIERLQRVRAELAVILRHRAPIDLPAAFSTVAEGLSPQDRSMLMIYSRVFDEPWLDELRNLMLNEPRTSVDAELDALPADADRTTRQRLAEQLAPGIRRQYDAYPALTDLQSHTSRGAETAKSAVTLALRELYNPAQLEVLFRADLIARGVTDERLDALDNQTAKETGQ